MFLKLIQVRAMRLSFFLLFYIHLPLSAQYISKAIDFQNLSLLEIPSTLLELENGDFIVEVIIAEVNDNGYTGLSKLNPQGEVIWQQFVDSLRASCCGQTIQLDDESFVVSGQYASNEEEEDKLLFVHLDTMGNLLSRFRYGSELENERLYNLHKLEEGFIAIAFLPSETEYDKPHLIRFSENLEILWEYSYEALFTTSLLLLQVHEDDEGNLYVAGSTAAGGPKRGPMIIKLNSQGDELWRFYDPKLSYSCAGSIYPTTNGNVLLRGCLHQSEHNESTLYWPNPNRIVSVTPEGNLAWEKNLWRYSRIAWGSCILREDGTYICTGQGHGEEYDEGEFEMSLGAGYIGCYDSEFNLLWERFINDERYAPEISHTLNRVVETHNNDLVFTGQAHPELENGNIAGDTWFVRTDSLGCLEPNCGFLQTIDEDGNYSSLTATEDIQQNPTNPLSVQISPNPAREQVTVKLLGQQPKIKTLTLVDVQGRVVKEYDTVFLSAEFNLDIPQEIKGICYLRALTEAAVWVKKIVVE